MSPPTAVHVRGKRKAPSAGARMPVAPPPSKTKRSLASVLAARSSRPRVSLESLPAEMLENILLYSGSLSLPRASPVIGVKLSDRVTLVRLFVWAFYETWEHGFGIPASQPVCRYPQPMGVEQPECPGDYALQSAVLELPAVKIDLILQAQQVWADRYGRGRWYQHCIPRRPHRVGAGSGSAATHAGDGGYHHFNARDCFEVDYQRALRWPLMFEEPVEWRTLDVHPRTRMPIDLMSGPWDDEKLRRLFWLTRGGIAVDDMLQAMPPWEVKLQFLDNAVLAPPVPNVLAINCLVGFWIFLYLPQDEAMARLVILERRMERGDLPPQTMDILRWARNSLFLFLNMPYYHMADSARLRRPLCRCPRRAR